MRANTGDVFSCVYYTVKKVVHRAVTYEQVNQISKNQDIVSATLYTANPSDNHGAEMGTPSDEIN